MSSYYGVGIVHGDNVRRRSSGVNLPLVAKKMGFRNRGIYETFFPRTCVSPTDDHEVDPIQTSLAAVTLLVGD